MTGSTLQAAYDWLFAPWVRAQGLQLLGCEDGVVRARLPSDPAQQFAMGPTCGQAIMSAIDTVMALAVLTTDRPATKGTVHQSTQFLRPANGALLITARVLRASGSLSYGEIEVLSEDTGDLVAHATSQFR